MIVRLFSQFLALSCAFALPAQAVWDRFEIIQWQSRDAAQLEALRRLGVTGLKVMADRKDGAGTPLDQQTPLPRNAGLRWYIENIATDLYASYHRYTPGKPVNWRFIEAQERYRANPADNAALFREPSLEDPAWRQRIGQRLTETVRQQRASRPLYYSLGDETGIADLSAYWDFDLSPVSAAGYRQWLRNEYRSLDALNAEWSTSYRSWSSIQPETTNAAMRRNDENFAAWNDFKAWMDTSFAAALRFGTDAVHRADPAALSAIEGVQIPGWGGYDYTKLARAVDVMEIGGDLNLDILHSMNPRVIPLTTSFVATPDELHRIWRGLLHGVRGLVLWDEDNSIVGPDASPGARAKAYAPVFAALRGEIGRRMIGAEPILDSVAVLYSPVSFRVQWMLDHRPLGDAWMQRSAEFELEDNAWRVSLREFTDALERMGLRPRFISNKELSNGPPGERVLVLPRTIALSQAEAEALRTFAARGGKIIADTPPGQFDGHGRRQSTPSLPVSIVTPQDLPGRLGLAPAFPVTAPNKDVDAFRYRTGRGPLLVLHRRSADGGPETVSVDARGWRARDIATNHDYGKANPLVVTLDPITPTFLELSR